MQFQQKSIVFHLNAIPTKMEMEEEDQMTQLKSKMLFPLFFFSTRRINSPSFPLSSVSSSSSSFRRSSQRIPLQISQSFSLILFSGVFKTMNDCWGRYGTKPNICLRIGQLLFATTSVAVLFYSRKVKYINSFWFWMSSAYMLFVAVWGLLMSAADIYALKNGLDLRAQLNYYTLILRGDSCASILALISTSSLSGIVAFYTTDIFFCTVDNINICTVYLISVILSCGACICIWISTLIGYWIRYSKKISP